MQRSEILSSRSLFSIVFALGFATLATCSTGISAEGNKFEVTYLSATLRIVISGNEIKVTRIQQQFDNPVSATPSSMKTSTTKGTLSAEQIAKLRKLILGNGFMALDQYYGAPERQRYYPYTIDVSIDGKKKIVTFRSNPSYPGSPEPFKAVEAMLDQLSSAATTSVPETGK